jgi:selenocysteine lyase/cysteine desulfurase
LAAAPYRTWEQVRAAFPLTRQAVHFTSFLLSPHPRPVADAVASLRRQLESNPEGFLLEHQAEREDLVLRSAAAYTDGAIDELAMTDSTTMGLGLLYGGLKLQPGDEIVTTTHDFYSTHESLRLAARRSNARLRKVTLYKRLDAVSADEIVSSVARVITPRTRVVALTWVHSSTGLKLPIADIAKAVDAANRDRREGDRALLCVDGVHGFGNQDVAVARLGCDFFVSGCHKWLFGPRGTGIVWGRRAAWARTTPTIPTFDRNSIGNWIVSGSRWRPAPR